MRPRVVAAVRSAARAKRVPLLLFLAGPNGAGKSTFYKLHLRPALGAKLPFVNADEIAEALHEFAPATPAEELSRRAFEKTEQLRAAFTARRESFCTETVFSDPYGAKLDYLRRARAAGYAIFLVFIGLDDAELSVARVMQRVEEGGHDVADEKLQSRFPRTLANLRSALALVDEAFVFDNSSDLEPYRWVASYRNGALVDKAAAIPLWARGLPGLDG